MAKRDFDRVDDMCKWQISSGLKFLCFNQIVVVNCFQIPTVYSAPLDLKKGGIFYWTE